MLIRILFDKSFDIYSINSKISNFPRENSSATFLVIFVHCDDTWTIRMMIFLKVGQVDKIKILVFKKKLDSYYRVLFFVLLERNLDSAFLAISISYSVSRMNCIVLTLQEHVSRQAGKQADEISL